MIQLETDTKFYSITTIYDLLGDLLVVCDYGSKLTKFTHRKNIYVTSIAEANIVINKIMKIRNRHGYIRIK